MEGNQHPIRPGPGFFPQHPTHDLMPLKSGTMSAIKLTFILFIAGLFLAGIACTNPDGATPNGNKTGGGPLRSASTNPPPDGPTWVLHLQDGSTPIEGTFVWLKLDGDTYSGLDGCNTFGGRSEDGTPVAGADGSFTAPSTWSTQMLCPVPGGIMEQADRYLGLLRQGKSFRVADDRMEILDGRDDTRLIFVQQTILSGLPVDLAGTQWQLVVEYNGSGFVDPATLAFVDDHLAAGMTSCRGYVASYMAPDGQLSFPSIAMTEYSSSCSEEMRADEGRFTDDLSQAVEYSVSEEEGTKRLMIRTSRGRTLIFEPLNTPFNTVFGAEWRLRALVDVGQEDPEMVLLRVARPIPETEVTVQFDKASIWGSGGCNTYSSQLESGGFLVNESGAIDIGDTVVWNEQLCTDPAGIMEQEERFIELVPMFERFRIYGNLLVVHIENDVVLLFQVAPPNQ